MQRSSRISPPTRVTVACAADRGSGVAYAAIHRPGGDEIVRVGFACRPMAGLAGRDVAYAGLQAICGALHERGMQAVSFSTDDEALARDLAEHRPVPTALTVPYVALRCALNRFQRASVAFATTRSLRDLASRARAEVSLQVAA